MTTARGTFEVEMIPRPAEIDGAVGRLDFTKTFHGELNAIGAGMMLSGGDPQAGEAGYVAIETVRGRRGDHDGGFALQQFGTMHDGSQTLHYEIVPGSGNGPLAAITGTNTAPLRQLRLGVMTDLRGEHVIFTGAAAASSSLPCGGRFCAQCEKSEGETDDPRSLCERN